MYQSTEQLLANRTSWATPVTTETLQEKGTGQTNEDVLLMEKNTFGVFDGATSLDTNSLSGGLRAASIASQAFLNSTESLSRCAERGNQDINKAYSHQRIINDKREHLWSTSAAVVRLHRNHFEYCQIGDSLIMLLFKDGSHRLATPHIDHDRETLTLWKRRTVRNNATIQTAFADQIRRVRQHMNQTYGVLNGEPKAMDFLTQGSVELDGISHIILFTDGLFLPKEYPWEKSEWASFCNIYRESGLQGLRDTIRTLEKQDPLCRKYPRFKQHDDIAAISLHIHH